MLIISLMFILTFDAGWSYVIAKNKIIPISNITLIVIANHVYFLPMLLRNDDMPTIRIHRPAMTASPNVSNIAL